MMRYGMILLVCLSGVFGVIYWAAHAPTGVTLVSFGQNPSYVIQAKTASVIAALTLGFVVFYGVITLVMLLFGLPKRLRQAHEKRTFAKGLLSLTEGNWREAEFLLSQHSRQSKYPSVVSYIAAARAAHRQEAYERRDDYLRLALQADPFARLAVGVSQADMQLEANQFEQAYALLMSLKQSHPHHHYVLKLLARVLHRRESWDELLDLLPELLQQNLLTPDDLQGIEVATLTGLFRKQIKIGGVPQLKALWERLPVVIREQVDAIQLYAQILYEAGDVLLSVEFIEQHLNQHWYETLAALYGRIQHRDLERALQQAESWRVQYNNNPVMLLTLARLYTQQVKCELAKHYYESSLNQSPDAEGYLELAELLVKQGEMDNAQRCYQIGLRYSIHHKGERLILG